MQRILELQVVEMDEEVAETSVADNENGIDLGGSSRLSLLLCYE